MSIFYAHQHTFTPGEALCTICGAASREDCVSCPPWCTGHDAWETGELIAHRHEVEAPAGFRVTVTELLDVDAPDDGAGPHVSVQACEPSTAVLTVADARALARSIRRAAWLAEADKYQLMSAAIGREVEVLATAAGLTVADLGHMLDLSPRLVRRRLDGRKGFYLGELVTVAHALGADVADLVASALATE